ncbi:MAG: hypothetical protein IIW27_01000, partial [Clostridia bacterium]|nr:hypothetical protein [Clostridia bacterium]
VKYDATVAEETFANGTESLGIWTWDHDVVYGVDTTVSATEDGTGSYKIAGNNTMGDRNDGLTTFANFKVSLKKGTYTFSFNYRGDNMANSGADCATTVYVTGTETNILEGLPAIYWDCLTTGKWGTATATFTLTEDAEVTVQWKLYGLLGTIYLDNIKIVANA